MLDDCENKKPIKFGSKKIERISNRFFIFRYDETGGYDIKKSLYKYINQIFMVDSGIPLGSIIISTADLESMHLRVRFMWSKNILKHGLDVFTPAETAYYNPIVFNGTLDKFPMGRQGS